MRDVYSVNSARRDLAYHPNRVNAPYRRRLNKKKFAVRILLIVVLIIAGLFGTGFILSQLNIKGPLTETFNAVQKLFSPETEPAIALQPAATEQEQPSAEMQESASPSASAAQTPAATASVAETPSAEASETGGAVDNTYLPAFLQSQQGDMKAFSIDGIDPINDKVVALTFDDGPNPSSTEAILDALSEYGGKATFFVLGDRAEKFKDTIKKIADSGNEIGNHSYDHKDFKKLSTDEMLQEIDKTNDIISEAAGGRPILVRPPYGSITQELADEIGRACVTWTVDPEDWKHKDADIDYDNVMNVVQDGDIVLMHDIYKESAKAAERIIKDLTDKGYKLVTVSQMIQIAEARGKDVGMIVSDLRVKNEGKIE